MNNNATHDNCICIYHTSFLVLKTDIIFPLIIFSSVASSARKFIPCCDLINEKVNTLRSVNINRESDLHFVSSYI